MAIELEQRCESVRFGTKGPDKWAFIMQGILDQTYDGREHTFTIDGREVRITVRHGRPLPSWQCPSFAGTEQGTLDHDFLWREAWEFSGVGDGCEILGIYSPISRRGVYHFWPIALAGHMECTASRLDLRYFFAGKSNSDALLALHRAMEHMVRGSALGGYHVDCEDCWTLFRQLRQSAELP